MGRCASLAARNDRRVLALIARTMERGIRITIPERLWRKPFAPLPGRRDSPGWYDRRVRTL
jgi:hypothetical protein